MREVTASEASRHFSQVLDLAEQGETIVVTRGGRRVASISAAVQADGAVFRALVERWRDSPALDDAWADQVAASRAAGAGELDTDPWRD